MKADNCNICGFEFNLEKLGCFGENFRICSGCIYLSEPADDFQAVRDLIYSYKKFAQTTDPETASPNIIIEPSESLVQNAVNLLKQINPNYFVGVKKIVVDSGQGYGRVESGPNKNPAVIHLNLNKIKAEVQSKLGHLSKEEIEREIARQVSLTLSHERAHALSYKPEAGFVGGESPAEAEEHKMQPFIDQKIK